MCLGSLSQKCFESNTECGRCDKKDAAALQRPLNREDDLEWPPLIGLRHPASASCLGRHSRLAGRCPNNSSLFPPLAAVVVVALWASIAERVFFICSSETPAGVSELLFYGGKHTPPPYRDFAHNFAPFFGRCCPQKRFISLNFGAILNLAFLSVPAVPFGGIAGQIN